MKDFFRNEAERYEEHPQVPASQPGVARLQHEPRITRHPMSEMYIPDASVGADSGESPVGNNEHVASDDEPLVTS